LVENDYVYQFRIELLGIEPPVWRRIQVPASYTFWDLHIAIQDVMGWCDYHLHAFQVVGFEGIIGIPGDDWDEENPTLPGWEVQIADLFSEGKPLAAYEYDFGDSWVHEIRFEGYHPVEQNQDYPCCLGGARHCPPEDCGGVDGYEDFLRVMSDPTDPEHESMVEWAGGAFDPEEFDAKAVRFDDPQERWRIAFQDATE
jgi:hypothetical protein